MKLFILLFFLLISGEAFSNCVYTINENLRRELIDINTIRIEINDSKGWVKNGFKILKDKPNNIHDKFKKIFKAKIYFRFNDGYCVANGEVRQSGDWKDHIKLVEGGGLIRSINVHLTDGNISGIVKFKLLIPETRNNENEIIATIVLRRLGIIAPRAILLPVTINGQSSQMIFQESPSKELLEANHKREGPIFEGDEKLIWSYKNYKNFELAKISLSKLVNDKWASRGSSSFLMSAKAMSILQAAYMVYIDDNYTKSFPWGLIQNNKGVEFDVLMWSMGGDHGLAPHNRKFYWNALGNYFEPIYYDGNINPLSFSHPTEQDLRILSGYKANSILREIETRMDSDFWNLVNQDAKEYGLKDKKIIIDEFKRVVNNNIQVLIKEIENAKPDYFKTQTPEKWSEKLYGLTKLKINLVEFERINSSGDLVVNICDAIDCRNGKITFNEAVKIMGRDKKYLDPIFIFSKYSLPDFSLIKTRMPELNLVVEHSKGSKVNWNFKRRELIFEQLLPSDMFYISSQSISNLKIIFKGVSSDGNNQNTQRFNQIGLTGCLSFNKTIFNNVSLDASGGACEDLINIVDSSGELAEIKIKNSFQDALDVDFSNLNINKLSVISAGNDCLDFSGGEYYINQANLYFCADKGISIGERSNLELKSAIINSAKIGIAVKDSSIALVNQVSINNVEICLAAYRKKQEYEGGQLKFRKAFCQKAPNKIDVFSRIDSLN